MASIHRFRLAGVRDKCGIIWGKGLDRVGIQLLVALVVDDSLNRLLRRGIMQYIHRS